MTAGADALGLFSFLIRLLHVLAAMVWIGLVFFVNFVQLVALQSADEQGRDFLHKAIVPNVAWWFRHASTLTVASGAILLVTTGYLLPNLIYGAGVYVPPSRAWLIGSGVLGALAMWMFVHMYIWPNMQVVLGLRPGDADAKARARARVIMFARLNLDPHRAGDARHGGGGAPLLTWPTARAARPRLPTPSSLPRAPASPTATLRPCSLRRRRAPACWRWRRSPARLPACPTSPAASRPSARSACNGGAMRCSPQTTPRAPATPSPMPCAPRLGATTCPTRSCSSIVEARSLDLAGEVVADDAALQTYLWKSEGALFALAGRILAPGSSADIDAAAAASGQAYGLSRLLLGLAHALSHGRLPLPQSRIDAAGVTRSELLAGEGGPSVAGLLADLRDEVRSKPCHEPATCGEFAAGSARGLPSFGLGRVLSAGPGTAGPRSRCAG